jgi:hypothetical protein
MALGIRRLSEAQKPLGAINVARFEIDGAYLEILGGVLKVLLGEVDKPFHLAADCAVWLASKADAVHL